MLSGDMLSGDMLSGDMLSGDMLSGDIVEKIKSTHDCLNLRRWARV